MRKLLAPILALAIAGCGASPLSLKATADAKAKAKQVQAGPLSLFKLPDDGTTPIIAAIDAAKTSIDFKIYMVTLSGPAKDVVDALIRAAGRGVQVRTLIEAFPYSPLGAPKPGGVNVDAVKALMAGGVKVMYSRPEFKYTHEKSLVIDSNVTFIMTLNITKSSFTANREFGVISRRPIDVETVKGVFLADWVGETPRVPINPNIVISPNNSRPQIMGLIAGAQKSLVFESNSLMDPAIVALAGARAKAGVDVQVELAASREINGNDKVAKLLQDAGLTKIRFLGAPYIHAKVVIADGQKAYVGSENLTSNSLDNNREMGILLDDPTMVGELLKTAAADWEIGKPPSQPAALEPAKGQPLSRLFAFEDF